MQKLATRNALRFVARLWAQRSSGLVTGATGVCRLIDGEPAGGEDLRDLGRLLQEAELRFENSDTDARPRAQAAPLLFAAARWLVQWDDEQDWAVQLRAGPDAHAWWRLPLGDRTASLIGRTLGRPEPVEDHLDEDIAAEEQMLELRAVVELGLFELVAMEGSRPAQLGPGVAVVSVGHTWPGDLPSLRLETASQKGSGRSPERAVPTLRQRLTDSGERGLAAALSLAPELPPLELADHVLVELDRAERLADAADPGTELEHLAAQWVQRLQGWIDGLDQLPGGPLPVALVALEQGRPDRALRWLERVGSSELRPRGWRGWAVVLSERTSLREKEEGGLRVLKEAARRTGDPALGRALVGAMLLLARPGDALREARRQDPDFARRLSRYLTSAGGGIDERRSHLQELLDLPGFGGRQAAVVAAS